MTRTAIFLAFALAASHGASNAETPAECAARVQTQIDRIDARMRRPYTTEQGEQLRQQLRDLKAERYECRKKR